MNELPQDPVMLMSYINTKLRDVYPSLEALCYDMHLPQAELEAKLKEAGYEYSRQYNKFW